jgi:GNAT superfamily N-acetyltransferase
MTADAVAAESPPPPDGVVLRALTPKDAARVRDVVRAAFAAQRRATRPPSSALRETEGSIAVKLADGGGFGAFAGGALAAVALRRFEGDALHLGRVAALPERRRRGLARTLIAACEAQARARGLKRMMLRVRLELPENERLFERLGFVRRRLEAHQGFEAPTTAVMEKPL